MIEYNDPNPVELRSDISAELLDLITFVKELRLRTMVRWNPIKEADMNALLEKLYRLPGAR